MQFTREGRHSAGSAAETDGSLAVAPGNLDVAADSRSWCLFFFPFLDHVADARKWPDCDRILMLQCVLTQGSSRSILS